MQTNRRRFLKTAALALAPGVLPASAHQPIETDGPLPDFSGAVAWLNSPPLTARVLRGKVVLVNFWTYTCINSLRPLPYLKAWAQRWKNDGFVVIGVHTPEFSFEKEPANVQRALCDLKVTYPVVIDSRYRIWQSFHNQYWPAQYLIDARGRIRFHHFGEGNYGETDWVIRDLLKESGVTNTSDNPLGVVAEGIQAPPGRDIRTPETYVGRRRSERFTSHGKVSHHSPKTYSAPEMLALNHWALSGAWNIGDESAVLHDSTGAVIMRFHSRDLHMVLAPNLNGEPIRFRLKLDGSVPGDDCGVDSAPDGSGVVREPRLYQLIRQKSQIRDRMFEIEFLDAGVQAFVFTFG